MSPEPSPRSLPRIHRPSLLFGTPGASTTGAVGVVVNTSPCVLGKSPRRRTTVEVVGFGDERSPLRVRTTGSQSHPVVSLTGDPRELRVDVRHP